MSPEKFRERHADVDENAIHDATTPASPASPCSRCDDLLPVFDCGRGEYSYNGGLLIAAESEEAAREIFRGVEKKDPVDIEATELFSLTPGVKYYDEDR